MPPISSFTASLGHNGLLDIFAVREQSAQGSGAVVWRARQETPGGDWSAWASEGKPGAGIVDVRSILDAQQHGHVLAEGAGGRLWFKERGPADAFSAWDPLGGPAFAPSSGHTPGDQAGFTGMCGAVHANGRIDVAGAAAALGGAREIFYRARPAGGTAWTAWSGLGDNGFAGDIVAAIAGDDALDVVTPVTVEARQGPHQIDMSHRRGHPDGAWTAWALLGRPPGGFTLDVTPVLIRRSGGGLELLAVSAGNAVWQNSQAGTSWSGWAPLGGAGGPITGLAVAEDTSGGLNVCAVHESHAVTANRQQAQGGPWGDWADLGALGASTITSPALLADSQGGLHLLLAQPGQQEGMVTLRQQEPGGPFVTGPALPALPQ